MVSLNSSGSGYASEYLSISSGHSARLLVVHMESIS